MSDESDCYCPYCDHVHEEMYRRGINDGEKGTLTCDGCGVEFIVRAYAYVDYETYRIAKPDPLTRSARRLPGTNKQ